MDNTLQADQNTITLRRELDETKQEIARLRESIAKLKNADAEAKPLAPPPPLKYKEQTRYDFPSPTWTKETLAILLCVVGHFMLGISDITTREYVFLDIVGIVLCIIAIIIGSDIKKLCSISFAENSPTRIKADRLASTNGRIVAVTFIIGCIIIFYQSASSMFTKDEVALTITYFLFYFACLGSLWYKYFRPTKLDFYSVNSSPLNAAKAFREKIYKKEMRQWKRKVMSMGYTSDDFDLGDDSDWDINDNDWDSNDSSSDDWDWGGGDSGGGGASSEW